jgi:hypothetical protein
MDPAEARLLLRRFVDNDDRHVAGKCAAFVSAATPEHAPDLRRLDAHPLPTAIVPTYGFVVVRRVTKSFCDILS